MSNSTDAASSQFLAIHSSLGVLLSVITCIPAMFLGGLYIMALLRAKGIDSKMKTILINNFFPELLLSVSCFITLALHPLRAYSVFSGRVSCALFYVVFRIGQVANNLAPPFFAVAVYVFVKYGMKKLRWYMIVGYIVLSWGVAVASVIPLALNSENVRASDGFCQSNVAPFIPSSLIALGLVFCLCVLIIFAIANYCYVKRNSLSTSTDSSDSMKKALVKLLVFDVIKACFLLVQVIVLVIGLLTPLVLNVMEGNVGSSVIYYLLLLTYGLSLLLTPIVSTVLLKPVGEALRQLFSCMPRNCMSPASQQSGTPE